MNTRSRQIAISPRGVFCIHNLRLSKRKEEKKLERKKMIQTLVHWQDAYIFQLQAFNIRHLHSRNYIHAYEILGTCVHVRIFHHKCICSVINAYEKILQRRNRLTITDISNPHTRTEVMFAGQYNLFQAFFTRLGSAILMVLEHQKKVYRNSAPHRLIKSSEVHIVSAFPLVDFRPPLY